MNIFHAVTLKSLRKNRTRTIVTIIGIILSAAMICAVTTFTSSFRNFALQSAIYTEGAWHTQIYSQDYETFETIKNSDETESAIFLQQFGYAYAEGCQNRYKPYIYLLGCSEGSQEMVGLHLSAGRFPQKQGEIMLPDHLYTNGGVKYRLGDTITLDLGVRLLEGELLEQHNPVYTYTEGSRELSDETLEVNRTMSFTVVGFYERPNFSLEGHDAPGYTAFTLSDAKPAATERGDIFITMKDPENALPFIEENNYRGDINSDVLMFSGVFRYDSFSRVLTNLAATVTVIIMLGSISLIYNAFSISVSERTKQFGLLASVGATKRQLKKMVLFEALAVSSIGIPLGIASGIGGIGVTLMLIGDKFRTLGFPIDMTLSVSLKSVITAIAVSLITVLISAWIPSKRATKITAVEAIRQNAEIKNTKPVKTSKLTYKLFGLPGMLASKHYKRNRKRYRATVISLFMSIVLFVSASAFTSSLTESVSGATISEGCDLMISYPGHEFSEMTPDGLLEKTKQAKAVTDAAYCQRRYMTVEIADEHLTMDGYSSSEPAAATGGSDGVSINTAVIIFVNDETFLSLLKTEGLDENKFLNASSPLAVAYDKGLSFNYKAQRYESIDYLKSESCTITAVGQKEIDGYLTYGQVEDGYIRYIKHTDIGVDYEDYIDIPYEEATIRSQLRIGATIDEKPFYGGYTDRMCIVYPASSAMAVFEDISFGSGEYFFTYLSSNHSDSAQELKTILNESGFVSNYLRNIAEEEASERNIVTIINVFSYGFIVLISLIAAANVFNTINTNIGLRRREFAMLRSVGMTQRGFNRMMNFECLLYGSKALILGIPVSMVIAFLFHTDITRVFNSAFRPPWNAICIASLSVFIVVFAAMLYSMSRIKKENPIDALKNENL